MGDLPAAWGDASLINQVLMNLIGNAIKYTRSKDKAVIEVGGASREQESVFYVKDNGVGFDERYGGRVWAQGEVGAGAAFYLTLPPGRDEVP